jgi:peptide subunit release factor 1 (eRF1)
MLDDLLGRSALKDRIETLEEELHHTERQLEAEQERRREAASARQDAEERVNRLEDRIADLEGQVDRANEPTDLNVRTEESLHGERLDDVLARLESVAGAPESLLSTMVADEVPATVAERLGSRTPLVRRAAPCLVYTDDAGLVCAALSPPVAPEPFVEWADRFRVNREWFQPTGRYALALVRADLFAVGVYEDGKRVSYRGFESDVKGDHSKGGFSQGRFERIRDGQIADHVARAREELTALDVDRMYVTGERVVVTAFEDLATVTRAVDATGKPEAALEDAVYEFWTTRCVGL